MDMYGAHLCLDQALERLLSLDARVRGKINLVTKKNRTMLISRTGRLQSTKVLSLHYCQKNKKQSASIFVNTVIVYYTRSKDRTLSMPNVFCHAVS